MSKFAAFIERLKAKSVSVSGGYAPHPLTRSSAPGHQWEFCSQTPVIGASQLYLVGLQLSSAGTAVETDWSVGKKA